MYKVERLIINMLAFLIMPSYSYVPTNLQKNSPHFHKMLTIPVLGSLHNLNNNLTIFHIGDRCTYTSLGPNLRKFFLFLIS